MKITRAQLKQIIKEELESVLSTQNISEEQLDESRYDCRENNCKNETGSAKEDCINRCVKDKQEAADKRWLKNMEKGY